MTSTAPTSGALRNFASLVKLSHTVFGLPFALVSAVLAHRHALELGRDGLDAGRLLLILIAFTAARTTAMGFNRIVDRRIDAANPRTADRELPRGAITPGTAITLTIASAVVFIGASYALSSLAGHLAWPCLALITSYSYFKRFSWGCHLFLGVCLALAPGGAWVAVMGSFEGISLPLALMVAVATWVAGFDIIYSLQDHEFDRARGLFSIPAVFGVTSALVISAALHFVTVAALLWLHAAAELGLPHLLGVGLMAALLSYEHWIVRPADLRRIDKAFFDINGYASLAYLGCVLWALAVA